MKRLKRRKLRHGLQGEELRPGFEGILETNGVLVTQGLRFCVLATVLTSNHHPAGQLVFFRFPLDLDDAVSKYRVFTWLAAVCGVPLSNEELVEKFRETAGERLTAAVESPLQNEFVGRHFKLALRRHRRRTSFLHYRFAAPEDHDQPQRP